MGRLALVLVALVGFFAAAPARAASVVIVRPASSPPVMVETLVRLKGELISAGFETEIVDGDVGAATEALTARRGADAVVAIIGEDAPDAVEVRVIDRPTGKIVVRRVSFEPAAGRASRTLALRAIELLRSSFLELDLAAQLRRDEPAAVPTPVPVPPPTAAGAAVAVVEADRLAGRRERFGVAVGAAAVMSLDGVGPAVLPLARVDWALRPWFVAQAALAGLGSRPTVEGQAGSAQVAQAYGVVGGCVRLAVGARVRPFASLSAGALHTSVEGRADAPNSGRAADQWSFLVDAGIGASVRVPDRFYVSLAAHAQLAEPYPAVRFLGAVVATSARPSLLLAVTVGAWL